MHDILLPKGMCSESRDLIKFWGISDNIYLFIMKIVHRVQVKRKQIQTEKRHKNTDTHIKKE